MSGLSALDLVRLNGVHPDLARVVLRAGSAHAFTVLEGRRSLARQAEMVRTGKSRTMHSRHLTGHAVDLAPVPLDWHDWPAFLALAEAMKDAAEAESVALEWGGDWPHFRDGPHYQLSESIYPAPRAP
jgi:peptidoglycan L-alanyl-D-glutamate endopeptidase CwlK